MFVWETWLYLRGWNTDWMENSTSTKAQNFKKNEGIKKKSGGFFSYYSMKQMEIHYANVEGGVSMQELQTRKVKTYPTNSGGPDRRFSSLYF